MIEWFRRKLSGFGGGIADLGEAAYDTFRIVWTVLTTLGRNALHAWYALYNGARGAITSAVHLALEVYYAILWAARVLLPLTVSRAVDAVKRWVGKLVQAVNVAWHLAVDATRRFVGKLVQAVNVAWHLAVDAVLRRLAAVVALLARVAPLVLSLLTRPDRLAVWIFTALWGLAWRTVDRQAEAILRWLLMRALWLVQRELPVIERVIARLF